VGYIAALIGLILLAGIIFLSLRTIYSLFYDIFWYIRLVLKRYILPLKPEYQNILKTYFGYYIQLAPKDKHEFENRLKAFMYSKEFIPRNIDKVSPEMRVLISASAIQLTFGLPMIYLSNFRRILIYPNTYYSTISKKYHHGETNPRAGLIVISWQKFIEGYTNGTDSLNVGLHELAHAIHFENRIRNEEYGFLDEASLEKLHRIFLREQEKIRDGSQKYLRAYAATDEYEFFAVSIEHFFEDPKGLKENIPDLYKTLLNLLNHDPARFTGP